MKKVTFQLAWCTLLSGVLPVLATPAWAENSLSVGDGSARTGGVADIPLSLSADNDAQGFVLVFDWDDADASGVEIVPNDAKGKPLEGADLIQTRAADNFMILAVVMNVDPNDGEEKIPAGDNVSVGTARIRCESTSDETRNIRLRMKGVKHPRVDGGPDLLNILAIGGRSIGEEQGLELNEGVLTCEGEGQPGGRIMFACGGSLDNAGVPRVIRGPRESVETVNFYYKAPGANDKIQGLSMAVTYSCDLNADEDSLDLDGGALKAVDAEFVRLEVDNTNADNDDDGCEFTLGVLIDAKSPFEERTLPVTSQLRKLFSLEFLIEDDADCGKCYWIKFMDGLNGNGTVDVSNLVSVDFQSLAPETMNGSICVEGEKLKFIRGDCNFSDAGRNSVDVADAAAAVGYFFYKGDAQFHAPCDDACDANDDGRLDAADVVFILNYLFVPRSPKPPSPGPTSSGVDPTNDNLGCEGAEAEC